MTGTIRIRRLGFSLALFLGLALTLPANAQEITGTITGTVTDGTGASLPGVTVTATETTRNLVREAVTGAGGTYTLAFLPVGTYDITFSLTGFKSFSAKAVEVHVNDRIEMNAKLDIGAVTDFSTPFSCQRVRIDMESLPTGTVIPNCGHNSMPTVRTASNNFSSSSAWPAAHIQLADNLMSDNFSMRVAAILVIASAIAKRAEAGAEINAAGVRSPIDIASPALVS